MVARCTPLQLFATAYELGKSADAERVIDAWIRGATARDILALAMEARASFRLGVWADWFPLDAPIPELRLGQIAPHAPISVAALLSTHRSGYVRELGLARLAASFDPVVVPFLLLRTDDIVDELRDRAIAAVQARLRPELAEAFARSLVVVELLGHRTRGRGPLVDAIHDFLREPGSREALLAASSDDRDFAVRRAALALRSTVEPIAPVLTQGLADPDARVRLWAARTAMSRGTNDDEKRALLPVL
jgi:hypothetical protein